MSYISVGGFGGNAVRTLLIFFSYGGGLPWPLAFLVYVDLDQPQHKFKKLSEVRRLLLSHIEHQN
jgi:hypothetical protein